jgi:hypothetical protein
LSVYFDKVLYNTKGISLLKRTAWGRGFKFLRTIDTRRSPERFTRKIPLFSVEPVTISYTHYWVHSFLPVKYFTCKNCLDWDIFHYFYFFTKYIALLSLIVKKLSLHLSYDMKNISLSFCSILYDIFNLYTCNKRNEKWVLRLCNFLIKKCS